MTAAKFSVVEGGRGKPFRLGEGVDTLDAFTERALKQFGFLKIAHKIIEGERLDVGDVHTLLSRAGLPVLMKLVHLKKPYVKRHDLSITPAVVLPLSLWLKFESDLDQAYTLASDLIKSISSDEVHVAFDSLLPGDLTPPVRSLIVLLGRIRPGVSLVGPKVEEIVQVLHGGSIRPVITPSETHQLSSILEDYRTIGITRLQSSTYHPALKITHDLGWSNGWTSSINSCNSYRDLAQELWNLNAFYVDAGLINVWSPGLSVERFRKAHELSSFDQGVNDLQLLRVLAVGTLLFEKTDQIRASGRYFSLEAMSIAHYLGANDLGFGAFDKHTLEVLHLKPFESLCRAVRLN